MSSHIGHGQVAQGGLGEAGGPGPGAEQDGEMPATVGELDP